MFKIVATREANTKHWQSLSTWHLGFGICWRRETGWKSVQTPVWMPPTQLFTLPYCYLGGSPGQNQWREMEELNKMLLSQQGNYKELLIALTERHVKIRNYLYHMQTYVEKVFTISKENVLFNAYLNDKSVHESNIIKFDKIIHNLTETIQVSQARISGEHPKHEIVFCLLDLSSQLICLPTNQIMKRICSKNSWDYFQLRLTPQLVYSQMCPSHVHCRTFPLLPNFGAITMNAQRSLVQRVFLRNISVTSIIIWRPSVKHSCQTTSLMIKSRKSSSMYLKWNWRCWSTATVPLLEVATAPALMKAILKEEMLRDRTIRTAHFRSRKWPVATYAQNTLTNTTSKHIAEVIQVKSPLSVQSVVAIAHSRSQAHETFMKRGFIVRMALNSSNQSHHLMVAARRFWTTVINNSRTFKSSSTTWFCSILIAPSLKCMPKVHLRKRHSNSSSKMCHTHYRNFLITKSQPTAKAAKLVAFPRVLAAIFWSIFAFTVVSVAGVVGLTARF